MYLNGKHTDNLEIEDVIRLIENEVAENRILDYKRELKIKDREEKKEFLSDISSFANTSGGIIIFGIEELKDSKNQNTGIPKQIFGLEIDNIDKTILQIEDIVSNNIEPKIFGLAIKFLEYNDKYILIIGINKGLGLPHMVTYNSSNKFYRRKNTGKELLDVYELYNLFTTNLSLYETANELRNDRIETVRNNMFIPGIEIRHSFFLHIIPLGYLNSPNLIDISKLETRNMLIEKLKPIHSMGYNYRYNLEGFMTYPAGPIYSYTQFFRQGMIEWYTTTLAKDNGNNVIFDGKQIEAVVIDKIESTFSLFDYLKIDPPYAVYITLFDINNTRISVSTRYTQYSDPISQSKMILPPAVFNTIGTNIYETMKPIFDIFWQMAGFNES